MTKYRIAVFAGPGSTITNSAPLNAGTREGSGPREPQVRPQRVALEATVYVVAQSAHPMEQEELEQFAAPDGFLNADGVVTTERCSAADTPVWKVALSPDDGLLPLPYVARDRAGQPWGEKIEAVQTFYPDASRIYEEIDRLSVDVYGRNRLLSAKAEFEYFGVASSAGYRNTATPPEKLGTHYFPYWPHDARAEPGRVQLAEITNAVQSAASSGLFDGIQWLGGSPTIQDELYWFSLLIDTELPIVGHAAQQSHNTVGSNGGADIIDGVNYIASGVSVDDDGRNRVGPVLIADGQVFEGRNVTKTDARPGNYISAGGIGGAIGTTTGYLAPRLTHVGLTRHTGRSELNLRQLNASVNYAVGDPSRPTLREFRVLDDEGGLLPSAIPSVEIETYGRFNSQTDDQYLSDPNGANSLEMDASWSRISSYLEAGRPCGFIGEGMSPYGMMELWRETVLRRAMYSGVPVVLVGGGNTAGYVAFHRPPFISGSNLTAGKARMLLMASMLKLGSLPVAADPTRPSDGEMKETAEAVARYQSVFDQH